MYDGYSTPYSISPSMPIYSGNMTSGFERITIEQDVIKYLESRFQDLMFYADYDIDLNVFRIHVWTRDKYENQWENTSYIKHKNILFIPRKYLKNFAWHTYLYEDIEELIQEVIDWCENYLNSKPEPKPSVPHIIRAHHCECCGAPLTKNQNKCEYCGVEYF